MFHHRHSLASSCHRHETLSLVQRSLCDKIMRCCRKIIGIGFCVRHQRLENRLTSTITITACSWQCYRDTQFSAHNTHRTEWTSPQSRHFFRLIRFVLRSWRKEKGLSKVSCTMLMNMKPTTDEENEGTNEKPKKYFCAFFRSIEDCEQG